MRLLKRRLHEAGSGKAVGVSLTTLADLCAMALDDYRVNGRRSSPRVQIAVNRLCQDLGADCRAESITADRITAFQAARLELVTAGSVNYECAILRRAFTLALRAGRVAAKPEISMLHPNNARKGFFEREQFEAVLRQLPAYLKPVAQCAYISGWRAQSELMTRLWSTWISPTAGCGSTPANQRMTRVGSSRRFQN